MFDGSRDVRELATDVGAQCSAVPPMASSGALAAADGAKQAAEEAQALAEAEVALGEARRHAAEQMGEAAAKLSGGAIGKEAAGSSRPFRRASTCASMAGAAFATSIRSAAAAALPSSSPKQKDCNSSSGSAALSLPFRGMRRASVSNEPLPATGAGPRAPGAPPAAIGRPMRRGSTGELPEGVAALAAARAAASAQLGSGQPARAPDTNTPMPGRRTSLTSLRGSSGAPPRK